MDGGASWEEFRLNIGTDTLSYDWTVPAKPGNQARIRVVQDNSGQDYQDESMNFTIKGSFGIAPVPDPFGVKIYPNPAGKIFYLESDKPINEPEIQLVSSNGAIVADYSSRDDIHQGRQEFYLGGLQSGIYYLRIKSEGLVETEKIIIH